MKQKLIHKSIMLLLRSKEGLIRFGIRILIHPQIECLFGSLQCIFPLIYTSYSVRLFDIFLVHLKTIKRKRKK